MHALFPPALVALQAIISSEASQGWPAGRTEIINYYPLVAHGIAPVRWHVWCQFGDLFDGKGSFFASSEPDSIISIALRS
jgi:hypothetical protein